MNIRPVPGFPGFEVSDCGRMFSTRRSKDRRELSRCLDGRGYLHCCYKKDGTTYNVLVHKAVLAAFVGPAPEGMTASHLNGDSADNRLSNLKWESMKDNLARRDEHGTNIVGERNGSAALTEENVHDIRRRIRNGETYASIGRLYGVTYTNIRFIDQGRTWSWLVTPGLEKKIPAGVGGA